VLTVRPLLQIFFPELARFTQPIGGIFAARRDLLRHLEFENDYGVDVGLLIDASLRGARLHEVNIGHIEHDSQDLEALGRMAQQVVRVILERGLAAGRLDHNVMSEAREVERHLQAGLDSQVRLHSETRPVVLLALDGVVLQGSFVARLAAQTGRVRQLTRLEQQSLTPEQRWQATLELFRGTPRKAVEDLARDIPLDPAAFATVCALRQHGFRVALVGELFHSAAEVIRRRVYADLCFCNLTRRTGPAGLTGELVLAPAFQHTAGCERHVACLSNVVLHLCERYLLPRSEVAAVGRWPQDACLLRQAGRGFALNAVDDWAELGLAGVLEGRLEDLPSLLTAAPPMLLAGHGATQSI
jgi:phosphoserine phosphatase